MSRRSDRHDHHERYRLASCTAWSHHRSKLQSSHLMSISKDLRSFSSHGRRLMLCSTNPVSRGLRSRVIVGTIICALFRRQMPGTLAAPEPRARGHICPATDGGAYVHLHTACPSTESGVSQQQRLLRTLLVSEAQIAASEADVRTTESPFEKISGFAAMDGQARSRGRRDDAPRRVRQSFRSA